MRGGHTSSPSLSSFSLWRLVSPPPPLPPCSGYLLPPTPSEKGGKKKEINNVNGLFISDMAPPPPPPPPHCSIAHTASLLLMFFCLASPYLPASLQGSPLARPTLFLLSRLKKVALHTSVSNLLISTCSSAPHVCLRSPFPAERSKGRSNSFVGSMAPPTYPFSWLAALLL